MSVGTRPLRLSPARLTGWGTQSLPDFGDVAVALLEGYSWKGRPVHVARASEVPMFWSPTSAAISLGMTVEDYLASLKCAVAPPLRRPTARSLVTRPKAVIYSEAYGGLVPGFRPIRDALVELEDRLLPAGIFAGEAQLLGARNLIYHGLPWSSAEQVVDPLPELSSEIVSAIKVFDPTQARGGDVLYIAATDLSDSDLNIYAWFDHHWITLPELIAGDQAFVNACIANHDRVKWLGIMGGNTSGNTTDADGVDAFDYGAQVAVPALSSGIPAGSFELYTPGSPMISSGALIKAKVQDTVRSFFGLV